MMKLLIVEDSSSQRQAFQRSVESLKDLEIQLEFSDSFSDALRKFQDFDPDCIFIDIRLSSQGSEGNDLFEFISRYKSSKIIRIITSHPGEINPEIRELVNERIFKIHVRTDIRFVDVIKEVYNIFSSPLYSLIGVDTEILEKIREIYYSQIDHLIGDGILSDEINKSRLFRYIGTNLQESFSVNSNLLDDFYSWEMFFCPPLLNFVYNGDIIKKKDTDDYFIILNPQCDLTPREGGTTNVTDCILAELEVLDLSSYLDRAEKKFTNIGENYIKNKKKSHLHFIPEIKGKGPFNINFLKIHHIEKKIIENDYERIASITPLFMKEIIHRFSIYYSRQGQPDLDLNHLFNKCCSD